MNQCEDSLRLLVTGDSTA